MALILSKITKTLLLSFVSIIFIAQANAGYINFKTSGGETLTWAIDTTDDDVIDSNDVIIPDTDTFDYESYTFVGFDNKVGSSAGIGEGDGFTDYTYFTAKPSEVIAKSSAWTGTFDNLISGSNYDWITANFATGNDYTLNFSVDGTDFLHLYLTYGSGDLKIATDGSTILDGNYALTFQFAVSSVTAGYVYIEVKDGVWVDLYEILNVDTSDYYERYSTLYMDVATTLQIGTAASSKFTTDVTDELDILAGDDLLEYGLTSTADAIGNPLSSGSTVAYADGNFVTVGVVPEPGMLSLMGLAFLGLAGFQHRRKTKN